MTVFLLYETSGGEEYLVDVFISREAAQRHADDIDRKGKGEWEKGTDSYKQSFPFCQSEWRIDERKPRG